MINKSNWIDNRKGIVVVLNGIFYYILVSTPFFAQFISTYLSTYITMLVYVGLFGLIISSLPSEYLIGILPLLGVLILELLNIIIFDIGALPLFIWGRLVWVLPVLFSVFLLRAGNKRVIKSVLILYFVVLFITSLTSIYWLQTDPLAARIMATREGSISEEATLFRLRNIAGFSGVYSTVILYPMVICLFKFKKINLLIFTLLTIGLGGFIFYSQYTFAILLFSISIFILLMPKQFKTKTLIIVFLVVIVGGFIFSDNVAGILYDLAEHTTEFLISRRLREIGNLISGSPVTYYELAPREKVYQRSLDAFFQYPVFGIWLVNDSGLRSGGHSFVLDTLARFGLFGVVALAMFYGNLYKFFYAPHKNQPFFGYMIFSLFIFFILGTINPTNSLVISGFVVPLIGHLCISDKKNVSEERHTKGMSNS